MAVTDADGNNICLLFSDRKDEPFSNDENNAVAISALPDLYEALDFLRSFHAGHVIANDDLAARLKQADAALSKARGEAQ